MSALDLHAIAAAMGGEVRGNSAHIPTPGHSPRDRGTVVTAAPDAPGGAVVHSFNGGDPLAIKDGLRAAGLLPERTRKTDPGPWKAVACFEYADATGEVIYRTVRREPANWSGPGKRPKQFAAERLDGRRWVNGLGDCPRIPYRLPELREAIEQGETVYLAEGEAKADKLAAMALAGTAVPFGAKSWQADYAQHFAGAKVVILPDNDAPGRDFARSAYADLQAVADCSIVELPGLPEGGDIIDWQGSADDLVALTKAASLPAWLDDSGADTEAGKPDNGSFLQSSEAFCAAREPADYLIDGSLRVGWLYTLTAPTGHGKSAVALAKAHAIAKGGHLGSNEVKQGHVLFLAGENADDIRERWIAMCERHGDDPASLPVTFMPGVCDLKANLPKLREHFKTIPLRLVVVDTLAAFFDGDNENDNAQQQEFATRVLRPLTELPGRPTVLVPAHPTKGAGKDSLTPKGGSSLLNAVDGNLSAWNSDGTIRVHWQGKFRGAPWSPMHFELSEHKSDKLRDSRGRIMPTVVARALLDSEIGSATEQAIKVENQVLKLLSDGLTIRDIAADVVADGKRGVSKSRVDRVVQRLAELKWITKSGRRWRPTQQGFEVLKQAGEDVDFDA